MFWDNMPNYMSAATSKKQLLTLEGLEKLRVEFDQLIKVKRPKVIDRIKQAREMGDLTENSEYDAAKDEQVQVEIRIAELEKILNNVQLITKVPAKPDFVVIGSTVVVEINDEVHEFTIVGSLEADPVNKKISNESPVGKAILGTKVGETLEVMVGPVKSRVKVLEIK